MKTFADLQLQNLVWIKAKGNTYELRALDADADPKHAAAESGELIASIKKSSWSNRAEVDAVGSRWTFERQWRFFKPSVVIIRSVGTGEAPAEYVINGTSKGTLMYPDGRQFLWRSQGGVFSNPRFMWTTEAGDPIIGFEMRGILQSRGEISIEREIADQVTVAKTPPLLVFLGWYLILLDQSDSMAAAMVATTVVTG